MSEPAWSRLQDFLYVLLFYIALATFCRELTLPLPFLNFTYNLLLPHLFAA